MKRILMGGVFGALALTLSSCYSTRILYGNVERNEPLVQVNRERNRWSDFGRCAVDGSVFV